MNFDFTKVFITTDKEYEKIRIPQLINNFNTFDDSMILNVSTVYTSVKILADTLSKLPVEIYKYDNKDGNIKDKDNYLYSLLHYAPNNYTTSQTFISTLEVHRNLRGNAFAKINRNNLTGRVNNLQIISPDKVKGYTINRGELYYKVIEDDKENLINASDILHFKGISNNGIWGLNPIESIRTLLSVSHKGMKAIDSYYSNNAHSQKVLKTVFNNGGVNKNILESVEKFNKEFTGVDNTGKVITLPPFTELDELSLNLVDAQFIETIKFNSIQIANLYGIPSYKVGDTTVTKFNSVEQMLLDFKTSTINNITRMYRQELEFKLLTEKERKSGISIEFNGNAMLEMDMKTKAEYYKTLANIGVIAPNEIARLENFNVYEGGDQHLINASSTTVEGLLKKIEKEGDK